MTASLEAGLRARLGAGGRCFVPYVTGGYPGVDADLLRGLQDAGADAVEVGVPFSDPLMDGGVIQEASRVALEAGVRPRDVLDVVEKAGLEIPVAVMTYVNPIVSAGEDAFLDDAVTAGVSGLIVPDLPVDEAEAWIGRCRERDVASVFLAAPGSTSERLSATAEASRGFVYCVATYGVTGARDRLGEGAAELVAALRPLTETPLVVGVGISSPPQAAQACSFADGVIVGSALMARLVADDPSALLGLAGEFRRKIPL
jgi:tryptophan synthase alpha chain